MLNVFWLGLWTAVVIVSGGLAGVIAAWALSCGVRKVWRLIRR